jgi:pyroglutamyl-peptidase
MKTVLLTGFEPFGGASFNPSAEIAQRLHGQDLADHRVIGAVLPCVFGKATVQLQRLIESHRPAVVICLGLAAGRVAITPERIAINLADARIADNAGQQPVDQPVVRGGPAAYWSRLPVKAIAAVLRAHGIPAEVSQSAGTFVCNHVFYALMHHLARNPSRRKGGFIHVPEVATGAAGQTGLPLDQMVTAIELTIQTALRERRDLRKSAGTMP